MTVGGRYTSDDKDFFGDIQSGFGTPIPRTLVSLSRKRTSFTPKLGFDYEFNSDVFGDLTASKGAKAGGFNGLSVLNPAVLRTTYGPQEVLTYEASIKAEWLDRRLRTNLTIFLNDFPIGNNGIEVTNALENKGYTRYDAFLASGSADETWEVSLQGKNLSDEANYVTGIVSVPTPGLALLRPRI